MNNRVLQSPGSKWSLADEINAVLPVRLCYLEPFFGSGVVFFRRKLSEVNVINDLDGEIVNLFRVIRERPLELIRQVDVTPFSRDEFNAAYLPSTGPVERCGGPRGSLRIETHRTHGTTPAGKKGSGLTGIVWPIRHRSVMTLHSKPPRPFDD